METNDIMITDALINAVALGFTGALWSWTVWKVGFDGVILLTMLFLLAGIAMIYYRSYRVKKDSINPWWMR